MGGKMKRFGFVKGLKKPKTEEEWLAIFAKNKCPLPTNISKIKLTWSKKGPGNTGVRYFRAFKVPPIKYWNNQISFELTCNETKGTGSVQVVLDNGEFIKIDATQLNQDQILEEITKAAKHGFQKPNNSNEILKKKILNTTPELD
eukprot:TRINITY_DN3190_c4_g1_i1.p1 TRINITY_DN3190_c4_g1~~TRINITY_DN3190_c4_g1_i1.p1  ORF type:complete len:145 (-),score=55.54 TRINITY_DN3190_c4_g1_i1:84-518(-)